MSEFKVIETQEQLDEVLKDRLERKEDTIRKEYEGFLSPEDVRKKYEGYLSPEDVTEKYKDYLSPEEAAKKDGVIQGYERQSQRVKVAMAAGIPYELAGKLSGDTEEDMKKDAEVLAKFLKKGKQYPDFTTDPDDKGNHRRNAMKKMLSDLKGE